MINYLSEVQRQEILIAEGGVLAGIGHTITDSREIIYLLTTIFIIGISYIGLFCDVFMSIWD